MRDRWIRTWRDLGVDPAPLEILDALRASYSAADRHYHDLAHIEDCLGKLAGCREEAERPAEIAMAIFFHDVIYDTHAADNELKSAEWARAVLLEQAVAEPAARRVFDLILATAHAREPESGDAALLCDIDLSILGETPEKFQEYDRRIGAEYSWVPPEIYRQKRREVLAGSWRGHGSIGRRVFSSATRSRRGGISRRPSSAWQAIRCRDGPHTPHAFTASPISPPKTVPKIRMGA